MILTKQKMQQSFYSDSSNDSHRLKPKIHADPNDKLHI